jgi:murein DD-endopeptidase MepM/ murein hydrolase activator NlpD
MMRVASVGLLALLLVPSSVRLPDGGRAFQASRRRSAARIASVSSDERLALQTSQISARSRTPRPGELVVLSIALPAPTGRVRVRAFGRDVEAYREGDREWRALVGIDLDVKPGTYSVTADADTPGTGRSGRAGAAPMHAAYALIVTPRAFLTRRLTVNEAFVTPPASERDRIEREAMLLDGVWKLTAGERLWHEPFVRPVPQEANSAFGTRSVFNGKRRNAHGGADFLSPAGTPIQAPNAGRIVVARGLYFSGNTVVIDHGLGLFSTLAHLSEIDVHEGDRVPAGHIIGRVGATGRVTGPHLHWAVRASGARVDPLSLLALLGTPRPQ